MADEERLAQLRARLISLRGQRQRVANRAADLERRSAAAMEQARAELDAARAGVSAIHADVAERRAEVEAFERASVVPDADVADWHRASQMAAEGLRQAEEQRSALEARAADADVVLARTIEEQEAASTEQARVIAELEREIELLLREISDLQAGRPLPDAPDPRLREVLLERLGHLDQERAWMLEEIAMRQERLRRVAAESNHIRSLLELHTPEWSKEAVPLQPMDAAGERTPPAWRAAVVDMLTQAGAPMYYRDIAEALAKFGQGLGGQDSAETLLAALSRDPAFTRAARGVYWLADRPLPRDWGTRRSPSQTRTTTRADRPWIREGRNSGRD